MPIVDGWINVFRLTDADPINEVDAFLQPGERFFGGGGGPAWMATTLAQALTAMDQAGIDRALLSVRQGGKTQFNSLPPHVETGLAAVEQAPDRLRLIYQIDDVSSPLGAARAVTHHAALPEIVGIGISPSFLGCDLNDRRLYPLYAAAIEAGVPVRINVGIVGPHWVSKHQHPLLLEELLIDFPDLTLIGAHMGHPWEQLMIRLIMKFEHLYLMTSAYLPTYFPPAVVDFMNSRRGRGRILFGSDYPMIPIDRAVNEAKKLPLSPEAFDQYMGTALCHLLNWP